MVTSTWRAPASMAVMVLATARPRSSWQWTLIDGLGPDEVDGPPDERTELGRDRVADGVGQVDRGRASLDDRGNDLHQVVGVAPGRVHRTELQLGVAAKLLTSVSDPADGLGQRLVAGHPDLVPEVDLAGRDEDVEVRPLGHAQRLDGSLWVAVPAAGEAGHGHASRLLGDPVDRLPVTR